MAMQPALMLVLGSTVWFMNGLMSVGFSEPLPSSALQNLAAMVAENWDSRPSPSSKPKYLSDSSRWRLNSEQTGDEAGDPSEGDTISQQFDLMEDLRALKSGAAQNTLLDAPDEDIISVEEMVENDDVDVDPARLENLATKHAKSEPTRLSKEYRWGPRQSVDQDSIPDQDPVTPAPVPEQTEQSHWDDGEFMMRKHSSIKKMTSRRKVEIKGKRLKDDFLEHFSHIRKKMGWGSDEKHKYNCGPPVQKAITLDQEDKRLKGFMYTPRFVLLHRCGNDTGCCNDRLRQCHPVRSSIQTVPFAFKRMNLKSRVVEYVLLKFSNHTECTCLTKTEEEQQRQQKATEQSVIPSHFLQDQGSTNAIQQQCQCPSDFVSKMRMTESMTVECTCECFHGDRTCIRKKRGHRQLPDADHECILSGRCEPPHCQHGTYNKKLQRCPVSGERG